MHANFAKAFVEERVEYPFNSFALASITITKESISAMLSLMLSVNGT